MNYSKFLQSAFIVNIYILIIGVIFLMLLAYKGYRYTNILSKKVYNLGKKVTPGNVEDLITYLDAKNIPFRPYTLGLIKGGYKIVEMDDSIDVELKKRLKVMVLSKGILVD